ncbi:MAG: DUF302 domain-containing protein [Chloroflexi bacterium]|nr:DUF302 domain-containing protein [Chloroflexota bacterium]
MVMQQTQLGFRVQMHSDYARARARVTEALQAEGFGVLTEIDVQATLKKKLNVDFRPYTILGACNPPLAYRALQSAPEVGLLLPCNVTLSQVDETTVEVGLADPLAMMGMMQGGALEASALEEVAQEARARLERVAQRLQE